MLKIFSLEGADVFIEKEVNEFLKDKFVTDIKIYNDWLLVFYERYDDIQY